MLGKLISFHIDLVNLEPIIPAWFRVLSSSGKMSTLAVIVLISGRREGLVRPCVDLRDSQPYEGYLVEAYANCWGVSVYLLGVENSRAEGSLFWTQTYTTT